MKYLLAVVLLLVAITTNAQDRFHALNLNQINYDTAGLWPTARFLLTRLWDTGVTWKDIETSAGTYNFTELDKQIRIAQSHGVTDFIYTAGKVPTFYGGGAAFANPPTDNTKYTVFVTALATHLKQTFPTLIWEYEQWNEPNLLQTWNGTVAQLLTLNRLAYAVLHPMGIRVLSPSGSGGTAVGNFILSYLTACASNYPFDVFTYHAYLADGLRTPNVGLAKILQNISVKKQEFGISAMPTWFTEGGWGQDISYTPLLTDAEQVAYLTTMYQMMQTAKIETFVWYAWSNTKGWGVLATGNPAVPNAAGLAFMSLTGVPRTKSPVLGVVVK